MSLTEESHRRRRKLAPITVPGPSTEQGRFVDVPNTHVRNLLTQLAHAQGSSVPTSALASTTSLPGSQKKSNSARKEASSSSASKPQTIRARRTLYVESKQQIQKSEQAVTRPKGISVAARMSKRSPGPVASSSQQTSDVKVFVNSNIAEKTKGTRQRTQSHCTALRPPGSPQKSIHFQSHQVTMGPKMPSDVLDDLCFRFLLNIPEDEQRNEVRICFQIELALWFYLDFYCKLEDRMDCKEIGMREFTRQMFENCDFLKGYANEVDKVVDNWRHYKSNVPTYGAILLDASLNHVLLVQGYYAKNSWGFPKGKVNESEHPRKCAIREVIEETGYDFGMDRPKGGEHKLQKFIGDTMIRLYIVPDVPIDYPFAPITRKEIKKIQWFNVWDLPVDKFDQHTNASGQINRFYTVYPFIQDLQSWIRREQGRRARIATRGPKGPQGKVAMLRSQEGQSAFTPVVPKTVNEKMNSAMDLLKNADSSSASNSSPRTSEEKKRRAPAEALFRPVGNESIAFSGHSFLQMLSSGTTQPQTDKSPLAQPIPLKPNVDQPVYIAPHEDRTPRKNKPSTSRAQESTNSATAVSASEMEDELMKLLRGALDSVNMKSEGETALSASRSSPETLGKEEDAGAESRSSASIEMTKEIPLTAAILAAEQQAAAQAQNAAISAAVENAKTAALQAALAAVAAQAQAQAQQQAQAAIAAAVASAAANKPPSTHSSTARSRRVSHVSEAAQLESPFPSARLDFLFGSQQSVVLSPPPVVQPPPVPHAVQLCEAWKEFKLDVNAIMAGIPMS